MGDKTRTSGDAAAPKPQGYDVQPPMSPETPEASRVVNNIEIQDPKAREENGARIEKDKKSRKRNYRACCETAFCASLGVSICQGCRCF